MPIRHQLQEFLDAAEPGDPIDVDEVAAVIQAAAPVKIWVLWTGDEEYPAEARFYSSKGWAMRQAEKLAAPAPGEGFRLEWRPARQGDGLPLYAGPEPVVPKPELFPDYLALFQVEPDGTERFYWQVDSALVDAPEPEPRLLQCPDDQSHGMQEVISVAFTEDGTQRIINGYRLGCLHVAVAEEGTDEAGILPESSG